MRSISHKKRIIHLVGIDEAGRGPLAGPVAVGVVFAPHLALRSVKKYLSGIRDSKKLSSRKREDWARVAEEMRAEGLIDYSVSLVGASYIDTHGITKAVATGIARSIERLKLTPANTLVLLDGGIRAPSRFSMQKTIIRGDSKEPLISLAAILAKVRRDRHMTLMSERYPRYGFEKHKGYGTEMHREQIRRYGVSAIHRKSFSHI